MKTIIAATDFSPISLNAVNYAADLAIVLKTDLSVIHAFSIPSAIDEVSVVKASHKEIFKMAHARMDALMEKLSNRVKGKIKITSSIMEGDAVQCINKYAESVNTYAVVMGSESGNAYERFLFGAKTIEAMRRLGFTLIIVPPSAAFSSICKIGLACDLKDVIATLPILEIKKIVTEFSAEFHVLHVSTETVSEFNPKKVEESGNLQEIFFPLSPRYDFIQGTDIEEAIIQFAEKNHLDMLIVVPKFDHMLYNLLQRSSSRKLVLHSHTPVISIHV